MTNILVQKHLRAWLILYVDSYREDRIYREITDRENVFAGVLLSGKSPGMQILYGYHDVDRDIMYNMPARRSQSRSDGSGFGHRAMAMLLKRTGRPEAWWHLMCLRGPRPCMPSVEEEVVTLPKMCGKGPE